MSDESPRMTQFEAHRLGVTSNFSIVIDTARNGLIVATHDSLRAANGDAKRRNQAGHRTARISARPDTKTGEQ